jgi:hypothetical protein
VTLQRLVIAHPSAGGQDTIAEHGEALAGAFRAATGVPAVTAGAAALAQARPGELVLVQYNPFSWGRWGVAPGLVRSVVRARRAGARVALLVHEPYVPLRASRELAIGLWQRAQLLALARACDPLLAVSRAWARRVQRLAGSRPVHELPVGSMLPPRRERRDAARRALDADPATIVLAQFGTNHPSRVDTHSRAAAERVAGAAADVVLLNLGLHAQPVGAPVREVRPGLLDRDALAEMLAAADVFLSPCVDGVTTRRTSVMSALQQGVPVVGTETADTDAALRDPAALRLVPVDDVAGFAQQAERLATAPAEERRRAGAAAAALYAREFDWDRTARRLAEIVGA